jgi:two-component sensor histidine kinase
VGTRSRWGSRPIQHEHTIDFEQRADELRRQRHALGAIGASALRLHDIEALLNDVCRLVAEGMGTAFSKVLEYRPDEQLLLVRAGIGWKAGVVGHARLESDMGSPAGFALMTEQPVISNDLAHETRFRTPGLLRDHGIARAVNVVIQGDGKPFGVLEVDSRKTGTFSEDDIAFLQAAANLIGVAVERGRRETELEAALEARGVLMREADHRIKNSLQLTASLLTLQRSRLSDAGAGAALDDAIARVHAVAATHRALHQSPDLRTVAFGRMLADLCRHANQLSTAVEVRVHAAEVELDAERAIPLGLIVSELLTNALRHAYPDGSAGKVDLTLRVADADLQIDVADRGVGHGADAAGLPNLGTTIVRALARQIGAVLETTATPVQGTTVRVRLPRQAP